MVQKKVVRGTKVLPKIGTGIKHDTGKLRMDLVSPEFLEGLATVLTKGAAKYGDRNWEGGFKYSRPYAALLRHLMAWARGEDYDEEGNLHLFCAACNLMFLCAFESRQMGGTLDNVRPKKLS